MKQEARRIEWTTWDNLNLWFDTWEERMLELGFATKKENGELEWVDLERMINIDETALTLDEATSAGKGGRPPEVYHDGELSRTGTAAHKSSDCSTGLFGCTAAGTALPPHFQFKTSATTTEREKIKLEAIKHVPQFLGRFGSLDGQLGIHDATFGCNEKGGMNTEEFQKYIDNL